MAPECATAVNDPKAWNSPSETSVLDRLLVPHIVPGDAAANSAPPTWPTS
jgi:hypothetical protein